MNNVPFPYAFGKTVEVALAVRMSSIHSSARPELVRKLDQHKVKLLA